LLAYDPFFYRSEREDHPFIGWDESELIQKDYTKKEIQEKLLYNRVQEVLLPASTDGLSGTNARGDLTSTLG